MADKTGTTEVTLADIAGMVGSIAQGTQALAKRLDTLEATQASTSVAVATATKTPKAKPETKVEYDSVEVVIMRNGKAVKRYDWGFESERENTNRHMGGAKGTPAVGYVYLNRASFKKVAKS